MKTFLLLPILVLLTGCVDEKSTLAFSSVDFKTSIEINHDYSEIKHLQIRWNNIFNIEKENYYVYLFSRICSHCSSIKNKIIEYALNSSNFYFVEDEENVVIKNNVNYTIGSSSAENLAIIGFPSLFLISKQILIKNIGGTEKIISELKL